MIENNLYNIRPSILEIGLLRWWSFQMKLCLKCGGGILGTCVPRSGSVSTRIYLDD